MSERVAHIPFSADQELRLLGAARWMRFMSIVQMCAGFLGLLALGTVLSAVSMGVTRDLLAETGVPTVSFVVGGVLVLALIGLIIWAATLLYQAADHLDKVVATDDDDQGYLSKAIGRLRLFFFVEAATGFMTALGALQGLFLGPAA